MDMNKLLKKYDQFNLNKKINLKLILLFSICKKGILLWKKRLIWATLALELSTWGEAKWKT